jgi:O-acetyl-ADP-ribose deacetylase (regulator of RNase III)
MDDTSTFNVHFVDSNDAMAVAWRAEFNDVPAITVSSGDILVHRADAIVSPANSFGFMDGGIDLAYLRFFGWELQDRLQDLLREEHFGELPVGQAVVVETGNGTIPYLISAPTMRMPGNVSQTANAYLAFRATLLAILGHNKVATRSIETVLVPGLGTGIGEIPAARAARQMRMAYRAVVEGHGKRERNPGTLWSEHQQLLS